MTGTRRPATVISSSSASHGIAHEHIWRAHGPATMRQATIPARRCSIAKCAIGTTHRVGNQRVGCPATNIGQNLLQVKYDTTISHQEQKKRLSHRQHIKQTSTAKDAKSKRQVNARTN